MNKNNTIGLSIIFGTLVFFLISLFIFIIPMPHTVTESYRAQEPYVTEEYFTDREAYPDTEYYRHKESYTYYDRDIDYRISWGDCDNKCIRNKCEKICRIIIENKERRTIYMHLELSSWDYDEKESEFIESQDVSVSGLDNKSVYWSFPYSTPMGCRYSITSKYTKEIRYRDVQKTRQIIRYEDVQKTQQVIKFRDIYKTKKAVLYNTLFRQWIGIR